MHLWAHWGHPVFWEACRSLLSWGEACRTETWQTVSIGTFFSPGSLRDPDAGPGRFCSGLVSAFEHGSFTRPSSGLGSRTHRGSLPGPGRSGRQRSTRKVVGRLFPAAACTPAPLPRSGSPTPGSAWAVAAGPRTSPSVWAASPPHYLTSQQKALLMLQRKAEVNFKQMLNKSPLLEGVQSHILLSYRF